MKKTSILIVTHCLFGIVGFAVGIYMLPILVAPAAPDSTTVMQHLTTNSFQTELTKEREGSDTFHWGQGTLFLNTDYVGFVGQLAPGPDYKLYLSKAFVESENEFEKSRADMMYVGDINTFDNFLLPLPKGIDLSQYSSVVIWCETFSEYISSGQYR